MPLNRRRVIAAPFVVIGFVVGLGALADWCTADDHATADAGPEAAPANAPRRVPRAALVPHFDVRLVDAEIASAAANGTRSVRALVVGIRHDRCVHLVEGELRLAAPDGTEIARVPIRYENLSRSCQIPIPEKMTITSGFASSPALLAMVDAIGRRNAVAGSAVQWLPSRVDDEIAE